MRRAPPSRTLTDPRPDALVPGVANRDARAVCDARVDEMLAARDSGDREALAQGLAEAFRMGLWRGRNLVGFDALIQDVLGLRVAEARELAKAGAETLQSPLVRADDRLIATWFRTEAALLPQRRGNRVELRGDGPTAQLAVHLSGEHADLLLAEIGKRVAPVSKFLPRDPEPTRPPRR